MPIVIVKGLVQQIVAMADASRDEVCGLLLGDADRIDAILPSANVAATPATRFEIDPATLIAAHRRARSGGRAVMGHYHSHPSGDATPSPRDAADAIENDVLWLIAAAGQLRGWRTRAGGSLHGRFDEATIVEVD